MVHKTTNALLVASKAMADGVSALFFPYSEVVVHEVKSRRIAYIANNLSKRKVGDDSAIDDVIADTGETVIGPVEKLNWDGRKVRFVSVVVRDEKSAPVYVVCININISVFADARNALDLFLQITKVQAQPEQIFKDDWQEKINAFLHSWLQAQQLSLASLTQKHKKALVLALHANGAFQGKSAADYIANVLAMGRATVFKYLKEAKAGA
nr:PAS domain-containing protein [uncultured Albidiferax sp.]